MMRHKIQDFQNTSKNARLSYLQMYVEKDIANIIVSYLYPTWEKIIELVQYKTWQTKSSAATVTVKIVWDYMLLKLESPWRDYTCRLPLFELSIDHMEYCLQAHCSDYKIVSQNLFFPLFQTILFVSII